MIRRKLGILGYCVCVFSTGEEAFVTTRCLDAIYKSAETGREGCSGGIRRDFKESIVIHGGR